MIKTETSVRYTASQERYATMPYKRCGSSGVNLPLISLGLWQNFGACSDMESSRSMIHTAFDLGVTHFDLANNYGPPYGSAEESFGRIYSKDLIRYRDELFISTKAGYDMWPGPYGDGGSRKYLIASCDQSLRRMGLDYIDVFYHHKPDLQCPLEETMQALDYIVRSGRALYVGLSNYDTAQTVKAISILNELGTPLLVHQPRYNMFDRTIEKGLDTALVKHGVGAAVFSPLAQGLLTDKYLSSIPQNSRAANNSISHFGKKHITIQKITAARSLNAMAQSRGQSLAQMAIAWTLQNEAVTSCIVGASSSGQILDSSKALDNISFSDTELSNIREIIADSDL